MGHVTGQILLGATPEQVFRFVSDPDHFGDYVAGFDQGRVISERATGPGARYEWRAALGPLRLNASERVVEWQQGERVGYEGELAGVRFRSSMEVHDAERGGTQLRVDVDYDPPRGGAVADALVRRLVGADVRRSLERLGRRFGARGGSPALVVDGREAALSHAQLIELYRRRARRYDHATRLYELMGFRVGRYRRMVADALALKPGDTVVEIGCGTGANFPELMRRVGPAGRIIGVDLTDAMLDAARARVRNAGWRNVELVQRDAASYELPDGVHGILSTLALGLIPEYDAIIGRGARALAPGGRWVVLDLKLPDWPRWAIELGLLTTRAYGVTLQAAEHTPWESMRRHMPHTEMRELYLGAAYLLVGTKPGERVLRRRALA